MANLTTYQKNARWNILINVNSPEIATVNFGELTRYQSLFVD
jgi:hypothetical protein